MNGYATPKKIKRPATITIPEQIWNLDLFAYPVDFPPVSTGLEVEKVEIHCRRLKKMPTTTPEAEQAIGINSLELLKSSIKWLEHTNTEQGSYAGAFLQRLLRTQQSFQLNASEQTRASALSYLRASIPEKFHRFIPDTQGTLSPLMFAMLEDTLKSFPELFKRYKKKLYHIAETCLEYTATTDNKRALPLINWMKVMLNQQGRGKLTFADIGCAVASGAKELITMKEHLAKNQLCTAFDGCDITPPPHSLQLDMLKNHHIRLYQANIVDRILPKKYDVLLIANLNRLLTRPLQEQLITNAAKSLNQLGILFINWRFGQHYNSSLCLQRHREHLSVVCHTKFPC